ncbi:MAG: beta-galactosidase, partial [Lentisphaeria bacterium]|nr:beta-galactosidase [Lentisphaeria bacterium]
SQGRVGIWQGMGKYDFAQIDAYAEKLFASVPDAMIICHFSCHMPEWWLKQFPDEAVVWDDGTRTRFVSLASEKFRKDLTNALSDTFKYIASRPWSRRILAFYAVSGYDGQWFQPMDYGPKQRFADYSTHMQKEFRNWLRKKYGNNVSALRKAWGDPSVTFDNAPIPSRSERIGKDYYLDPVRNRNVLDFAHCTAQQTENVISLIAATVKKDLGGILFGTYYIPGDTTYRNAQAQRPCTDGIYGNPNFDFAASPLGYDCHGLDQKGTGSNFAVNQTMRLNNVFYLGEDDSRTYLSMVKNPRWGNPDTFGTLAGLRRNMAKRLALGHGFWHYDMWGHWYSAPAIREHLRREIILMNELRRWKPLPELNAEAVNVVKVGTSLHKRMNTPADLHQVHFPRVKSIPPLFVRDSVLLRDLDNPRLPQYKLYVFDDCFALNAADRKKIDSVKKNGAVLLFTHAAGYSDWKNLSAENISSLTGIKIEEAAPGHDLSSMKWLIPADSKVFPSLKETLVNAPDAKRFRVNDPEVEIIGYYADDKTPAAAVKKHKDWTAVYLPNAFPSNLLLNEIGRYLKLHVYMDLPVIVTVGGRLVSVYCPVEQVEGQLNLPAEFSAWEVFTGKFHQPGKTLPLKMTFGETRLFFLGTDAEVREFSRIQQQLRIGSEK